MFHRIPQINTEILTKSTFIRRTRTSIMSTTICLTYVIEFTVN